MRWMDEWMDSMFVFRQREAISWPPMEGGLFSLLLYSVLSFDTVGEGGEEWMENEQRKIRYFVEVVCVKDERMKRWKEGYIFSWFFFSLSSGFAYLE